MQHGKCGQTGGLMFILPIMSIMYKVKLQSIFYNTDDMPFCHSIKIKISFIFEPTCCIIVAY